LLRGDRVSAIIWQVRQPVKLAWSPQENFDFDGRFFKLKGVRAKPKPYGGTALSQKPVVSIGYLSSAGALARFAVFKADEDKLSHDPLPAIAARSDWADHPDACLKVEEIAKRIRSFCAGGTVV
jgi:hypothetical protein